MLMHSNTPRIRSAFAGSLIAISLIAVLATVADARTARNAVRGAAIGAGIGALVDGGQGARTGAAAGAIVGAVSRR